MRWLRNPGAWLDHLKTARSQLLWLGLVEAFGLIAALTAASAFATRSLGYPSPALLHSLAQVGVALLLAYVLEAIWLVRQAERRDWHENWLGFVCGVGLAGLVGIAAALAIAAHREAGGGNTLDDLGLWWSIASLGLVGLLATLQPFLLDRSIRNRLAKRQRT